MRSNYVQLIGGLWKTVPRVPQVTLDMILKDTTAVIASPSSDIETNTWPYLAMHVLDIPIAEPRTPQRFRLVRESPKESFSTITGLFWK